MRPFVGPASRVLSRGLLVAALAISSLPTWAAEEKKFIDWKSVPQSQAPDRLAEVVCELEPVVGQKAILVLPLQMQAPRPAGTWNLERYLMTTFEELLKAGNLTVVDAAPCKDRLAGIKGAYDKLAPKLILELAKAAEAGVVLAPMAARGGKPAIQFIAYDGEEGKAAQMVTATFKPTDLDYLACTPPANRAFIQWCEENFDKKIDRGECWDLPAKGIPAVGSSWGPGDPFDFGRLLDPDETPFPGDPLATKDRRHTMVTYRFTGDGKFALLHQNWDWGKETGRKIGWGGGKLEGHDFWRVRPREGEDYADLLAAARERPKEERGVTTPKGQRAKKPIREAAPKETEAAALSAD